VTFAKAFIRVALPLLSSLALWSISTPAAAATDTVEPPSTDDSLGNHQKNLRMDLGLRTQFVSSAGLDPFSKRDVVPHLTLGASLGFWARDRLSLAASVSYDFARLEERARSADAELELQRFVVAPELRYHVLRVLALTAKVGPSLTRQEAQLSGGLGTPLRDKVWKFGFDATAGVAAELWGYRSGTSRKPRFWLTAEGGYGFSAPNQLSLRPHESSEAPQRLTPLDVGELSLSGPLFRVTAALSFW
jgi:hypothetical protein